jgi:hypothetical protein
LSAQGSTRRRTFVQVTGICGVCACAAALSRCFVNV